MKIRIKNIPEGFEIRNKKLVKKMAAGGSITKNTLQPVPRDEANVEAEKNETVLTDADGDGFFELYNIGGKRHSHGGTPLNLPEQSFIYSDTRKMKFTKEEMKELGINSKKRLTPAAVSKMFPVNKYMDILKDESADQIAITTAEAMIKKNKIKLSHIAFLQEKKKNFEDGLPLAAYPWLLENGVDPKEFEAKLEQKKQQDQQGQAPQGPAGGQGQPSPQEMEQMAMAMQQQGQGMPPQGAPQGMPPQAPPMQGPPQGMPPGMPPQGMMPPMGMAMGGMELRDFVYGEEGKEIPTNKGFKLLPPAVQKNIIDNMQNGGQPSIIPADMMEQYNAWRTKNRLKDIPEIQMMFLNTMNNQAPIMPGHSTQFEPIGPISDELNQMRSGTLPGWRETLKGFIPDDYDYVVDDPMQGMQDFGNYMYNNILDGVKSVKDYMYKDTPATLPSTDEITSMFYKNGTWQTIDGEGDGYNPNAGVTTKQLQDAYDRAGMQGIFMAYYSNLVKDGASKIGMDPSMYVSSFYNMPTSSDEQIQLIPEKKKGGDFKPHMMYNPETGEGFMANVMEDHLRMKEMGYLHKDEMQMGGQPMMDEQAQMNEQQRMLAGLAQAKRELTLKKQEIISQFASNPETQDNPEAQAYLESILLKIDQQIFDIDSRIQLNQEKDLLNKTTLSLKDFTGESTQPLQSNQNYEYFNPDRLMRRGGSIGRSIPRFQNGNETNNDDIFPNTFYYRGETDDGYPISLNPYYREETGTSQYIDGVQNPNYDADFEGNVDKGITTHNQFYDIMVSPRFDKVRAEWIQAYKDLDVPGKIDTNDEVKLFKAFNDMNILLNAAFSSGLEFKDKTNISKQLKRIANKMGIAVPTEETIKMYQGMYNSLATAKLLGSEETKNLLEQVNVNFGDKAGGAYEIIPGSGQYVSDIDGLIGNTTSRQFVSVNDEVDIDTTVVDHPCDEETKRLKIQECMEKGEEFNEKTCDCFKRPVDTPPGKLPPYLTFPGDDLKVGALASITRDKKYGILQNYDPILRDPGYVDDRAQVAATTALANQAMNLGNVSDVQGRAQDQIDKIQANRWATNTKIFDNTQAYNVAEINKARQLNAEYMQDYQDMVNKVDQEYDNTKIADMMNLVDAEVTRMDNADKLYELNLKNPNYYFDPQRHKTIFQNPQALEAFRGNPNAKPVTMAEAINECKTQYGITDEGELLKCAEMRMKSSNVAQDVDYTRGDVNVDNNDNTTEESRYGGSYRYGGTIRERDLKNSSNKLRKWIMGIE